VRLAAIADNLRRTATLISAAACDQRPLSAALPLHAEPQGLSNALPISTPEATGKG